MPASTVLDPLQVERCSDGKRRLLQNIRAYVGKCSPPPPVEDMGEDLIEVPKGLITNYSSLPPGTRWVVHWSRVDVAGVVHDHLYSKGQSGFSRLQADLIWFRIARRGCRRANLIQAAAGYAALVLFGWWFKKGRSLGYKLCWAIPEGVGIAGIVALIVRHAPSILECARRLVQCCM